MSDQEKPRALVLDTNVLLTDVKDPKQIIYQLTEFFPDPEYKPAEKSPNPNHIILSDINLGELDIIKSRPAGPKDNQKFFSTGVSVRARKIVNSLDQIMRMYAYKKDEKGNEILNLMDDDDGIRHMELPNGSHIYFVSQDIEGFARWFTRSNKIGMDMLHDNPYILRPNADDMIIYSAERFAKKFPNYDVRLVSKDTLCRIKTALTTNIVPENLKMDLFNLNKLFRGFYPRRFERPRSTEEAKEIIAKIKLDSSYQIRPNMFIETNPEGNYHIVRRGKSGEFYLNNLINYEEFMKFYMTNSASSDQRRDHDSEKIGQFVLPRGKKQKVDMEERFANLQNSQEFLRYKIDRINTMPKGEQPAYLELLAHPDLELITLLGAAGTGKTIMALLAGIYGIERGTFQRIVYIRSFAEIGRELGYLPGNVREKIDPWMAPFVTSIDSIFGRGKFPNCTEKNIQDEVKRWEAEGYVKFVPLNYLQGDTIFDSLILMDEAHNAEYEELDLVATRVGKGSKLVICGDPNQLTYIAKARGYPDIGSCGLIKFIREYTEDFRSNDDFTNHYGHVHLSDANVFRSKVAASRARFREWHVQ